MNNLDTKVKGRGMLYVHSSIWENGLDKPTTPEQWHKALLLPDNFEVQSIGRRVDYPNDRFELTVLSETIPTDTDHITQTEITPYYYAINKCMEDGTVNRQVILTRIDVNQWNGEKWETVATQCIPLETYGLETLDDTPNPQV